MTMLEKLALPEVRELTAEGDLATLREVLNRWLPADIADLPGDLSSKEDIIAFQCLTPVLATRTLKYLPLVAEEKYAAVIRQPPRRSFDLLPVPVVTLGILLGLSLVASLDAAQETRPAASGAAQPTLTLVQAVILGFVEGATEYLPVSSTGHLLIVEHLLGLDSSERQLEAAHSLAICIQCGAILAVLVLYFGRIRQILRGVMGRDADGLRLLINLIIAFLPAAVIGLLFNRWIKQHLFGVLPVAVALFVGGVIIVLQSAGGRRTSTDSGKDLTQLSWRDALFVGVVQCLAFWPGFSRSLATILGCRFAGVRMTASVEFSFLLGLITLTAATAYEGLKNGEEMIANYGAAMPLVSLITAFVAALVSVRFMVNSLGRFGLAPFGYYRIVLALVCLVWLID
jgi:undecaprenyl-diphosphatase